MMHRLNNASSKALKDTNFSRQVMGRRLKDSNAGHCAFSQIFVKVSQYVFKVRRFTDIISLILGNNILQPPVLDGQGKGPFTKKHPQPRKPLILMFGGTW